MASRHEPVLVVGLGRFGSALALQLVQSGTEVLAIDSDAQTVQSLAGRLSQLVVADSTNMNALKDLGAADFKIAVVAIGSDMQASILTTSLLSDLGISSIWAKALTDQHAQILKRVGAHHVVLPERDMGLRLAHLVSEEVLDYLEVDDNWTIARMRPPAVLLDIRLGESGLRARYGVTVIAVKREGAAQFSHADYATQLAAKDEILIMGSTGDVARFAALG